MDAEMGARFDTELGAKFDAEMEPGPDTGMDTEDTTIGDIFSFDWPEFKKRLFYERAALRILGFNKADEIIQEQFVRETEMQSEPGYDEWLRVHLQEVQETIDKLHTTLLASVSKDKEAAIYSLQRAFMENCKTV